LASCAWKTGERQAAALRFYLRAGFGRARHSGDYAAMRLEAVATSIFMEKRLTTQTA